MAQFTWNYDSPSGTYKSHAMSMRLYEVALQESKMMDFVRPIEGYGRKRGESRSHLTRVAELAEPTSPVLRESYRIPEDAFTMSTKAITPQEIGRAVPYTSLSDDSVRVGYGQHRAEAPAHADAPGALDTLAGTAFKAAAVKYVPYRPDEQHHHDQWNPRRAGH
jgi:hypothetical protein